MRPVKLPMTQWVSQTLLRALRQRQRLRPRAVRREAAWRDAKNALYWAEDAAMTAADHSKAAIEAAKTELQIDGTMYSAGESSVDTDADKSTSPAGDKITGFLSDRTRSSAAITGQAYNESAPAGQPYRQAVAARTLKIGKTLDTSDDAHRLTIIHSRPSTEMMRVYVENAASTDVTDPDGDGILVIDPDGTPGNADDVNEPLKSLGMYIEAADVQDDGTTPDSGTTTFDNDAVHNGDDNDNLDHSDLVEVDTKPKELFSYVDAAGVTQTVVEASRTINSATGVTAVTYQHVDTLAPAGADAHGLTDDRVTSLPDQDDNPESIVVRASIPMAVEYEHIHFGVWGMLGAADKTNGSQKLADLGIGFVQNISGSGITDRLGIGTVTYKGNYVAHVQRQNATAGTGAIKLDEGDAQMTADFDKEEFKADLNNLAMLEGTLDGNGFSGMKATVDSGHTDLDPSGTFVGEFSGGIYGDKGEEAAGVFDFDGGEAGAFVGAFGGTNQE